MCRQVIVSRCFLLVNVHVSELSVQVWPELVTDSRKQTVLVEGIIHHPAAEVEKDFVHQGEKRRLGDDLLSLQRHKKREIITYPKSVVVTILLLIVDDLFIETLLKA